MREFTVRLLQLYVIGALQSHSYCQQTQNAKLKKCVTVLSRVLKSPRSVTARKSFGSEFHACRRAGIREGTLAELGA